MTQRQLSVGVLAGGSSSRMGTDKALLPLDGRPLADHICGRLGAISDDVFVVAKRPLALEARVVLERMDEQAPLAGIITAVREARHPLVFVCACDMPFISPELVGHLADRAVGIDAVVPTFEQHFQPLHAVWSTDVLPKLESMWEQGERAIFRALQRLDIYVVNAPPESDSFTNINTPEEFGAIRSAPIEREASPSTRSGS